MYKLMDKKRNILMRELMELIDKAKDVQSEIDSTFSLAYLALQQANIEMGINTVTDISNMTPEENSIEIKQRSIMGTEIPLVEYKKAQGKPTYAFFQTKLVISTNSKTCFIIGKEIVICFFNHFTPSKSAYSYKSFGIIANPAI